MINIIESLKQFYERNGLNPNKNFAAFQCQYKEQFRRERIRACSQSYVGEYYNSSKVVVIGLDFGIIEDDNEPTIERQKENIEGIIGKVKNPHMYGTTAILMELFNCPSDYVLKFFALTNWVKCGNTANNQSHSTETMINNCANHLTEELKILEPQIMIFQGAQFRNKYFEKHF
jgi:uracil-DNA glycosylase